MITFSVLTRAIQLRDPLFQNAQILDVNTIFKTAMDGSIRSRRGEQTTRLNLRFTEITRRKAMEFRDFVIATAGQKLRYIDFNSVSWYGYIITEPDDIITYARGLSSSEPRAEACELRLEFEING